MSRRLRVRVVFLAFAGVLLSAEVYLLLPDVAFTRPTRRRAAYEQIQVGMTVDEVYQLLGEHGRIPHGRAMVASNIGPKPGSYGGTWFGYDMVVQVWFSEDSNRVTEKEYRPVIQVPQSTLANRIRRWLGL